MAGKDASSRVINFQLKSAHFILAAFLSLFFLNFSTVYAAHDATLFFAPSDTAASIGKSFVVNVNVSSSDQSINAVSGAIRFPADLLQVTSVSKSGTIISLWTQEPSFSNSDGRINFEGIVLNPGYTGSAGKIIAVTFKVKAAGQAVVVFSSGSILANDGLGTNILQSLGGASFTLGEVAAPTPAPETETPAVALGVPAAPTVSSLTHPDPNQWYTNSSPEFNWQIPAGVTAVQLLVGRIPNAAPTVTYAPPITTRQLGVLEDGEWYFHIRMRNQYGWGGITHRKILIDTVLPEPFTIAVDTGGDATNPSPTLRFSTTDETSGIAYYEIKVGLSEPERVTPALLRDTVYIVPSQAPGKHTILIKAVDGAGNFSLASAEVTIEPIKPPTITAVPTTLQIGDTLTASGQTDYADSTIVVVVKKEGEEPQTFEVTAGNRGDWTYVYPRSLEKGTYQVWAYVIDYRGGQSEPAAKVTLAVTLPPILQFGQIAIDYLSVIITLVALVTLLLVMGFYFFYRFRVWRGRIRKETKAAGVAVVNAFKNLHDEIEKQIEFLDGKTGLNKDERRVRDRLKKSLDASQKAISKEIKDIEKEVK